jgi:predicted transcriptional regulator of viral defense system
VSDDEHLPHHLRRAELLADGWEPGELRRLLRTGRMVRIGPGAYLPAEQVRRLGTADAHRVLARAALERLGDDAVLSHASAALVHGLPDWGLRRDVVQVTRPRDGGGRVGARVRVRTAPLAPDEVVLVDGLPTTAVARTVVDVLREVPFEVGVVVADAALHAGAVTPADLRTSLASAVRRPGVARARRVVAFADGRSESVGESRSRVALARCGLPAPDLQTVVLDGGRRFVARTDFLWPEHATVGEFDGMVKYAGGASDRPPSRVVSAEKLREDALRDLGLEVVRWVWSDLRDLAGLRRRVDRAFARSAAGRTPHSAHLVVTPRTS